MAEPQTAVATQSVTPESRYLEKKPEILTCLKQLRDQRATLTLRIDGTDETYSCKVLDVSNGEFLIEDIVPRSGIQSLRDAKRFNLSARGAGMYVYAEDLRLLKWDQERGIPYFHVSLPRNILFQQRRRAARFRLPLRVSASGATITVFNDAPMVGRIIDISAGGCRAEFPLPAPWPVKNEDHFDDCAITIPKLLEIHSEAVIRHFHENKHSNSLVCGIELTKMHVTDRRRLEHFIQTIAKSAESA